MSNTRIKCITLGDGSKEYYAQYGRFWAWNYFYLDDIEYDKALEEFNIYYNSSKVKTLEFCQKVIDNHILLEEVRAKLIEAGKIISTEYIKYP